MLFQKNLFKKYLGLLNVEQTQEAWNVYKAYFLNEEIQQNIQHSKDELLPKSWTVNPLSSLWG